MLITSKQNASYKQWNKLKLKKYRDQEDMFLVYGSHLIEEAKKYGALVDIITDDESINNATHLSRELMDGLQQTETYINQIGLCKKTNLKQTSNKVLILDDIQDPDNLGALLRSASAFDFMHVILSPRCADVYNEKTIRASKGAFFHLYIERKPLIPVIEELSMKGYQVIVADAHDQKNVSIKDKLALVLGNEGHGVSEPVKNLADGYIKIETKHVESLNVSVAGAILMHEWRNL